MHADASQLLRCWVVGARELLSQASSSLGVQPEHWVQASSLQQLQQAVRSIRQQQMELTPELRLVSVHCHSVACHTCGRSSSCSGTVVCKAHRCVFVQLAPLYC
jgi:hypothetical protein